MFTPTTTMSTIQASLMLKIKLSIWTLRSLACIYSVWIIWHIVFPLLNKAKFLDLFSKYWQRDLAAIQPWQITVMVLIEFATWLLLPIAIMYWWKASAILIEHRSINAAMSTFLQKGAWYGISCSVLTVLLSPFTSFILTLHLAPELRLWNWILMPSDILGILISIILLMLSYLMIWVCDLAEDNKGFV